MDEVLKKLHQKEKELREQLEQTPVFKQWESVRTTISLFASGEDTNGHSSNGENGASEIPKAYTDELTWKQRVLFVLSKIRSGYVEDLARELIKVGMDDTEENISKRVSTTASNLPTDLVGKQKIGKKVKYFILT